jgi:hypothetical protein
MVVVVMRCCVVDAVVVVSWLAKNVVSSSSAGWFSKPTDSAVRKPNVDAVVGSAALWLLLLLSAVVAVTSAAIAAPKAHIALKSLAESSPEKDALVGTEAVEDILSFGMI